MEKLNSISDFLFINSNSALIDLCALFNVNLSGSDLLIYENTDKNYSIVHALDGYDEISLTSAAKVINNKSEQIVNPDNFGLKPLQQKDIYGGNSIESSAKIFVDVLDGNGTDAQNNVVCANASLAISTVKDIPFEDSFNLAKESLISGKAKQSFKKLVELSQ